MNIIIRIGVLLLMQLLIFSCGKKDDDTNVVINIEEEFDVLLVEKLIPGTNPLQVHVRTREALECTNYDLGHSNFVNLDKNEIIFSIDELELEGPCASGESFVDTNISIGNPTVGDYEFQINLSFASITNKGTMIVSEDYFKVRMETTHGITLLSKELHTIPDSYFWGYFQLVDASATEIRDEFYTDLQDLSAPSTLSNGHYGHFDIIDGVSKLNPILLDLKTVPPGSFIYQLNGDKSDLLELVKNYQTTYQEEIKIVLYTAEGEVL